MRLATWNVNSLKVRLPHVLDWLATADCDVLCLQETKLTDDKFPAAELQAAGYSVAFSGQKTYNGVAILSRLPMRDVACGMPDFADEQKRVIAATIAVAAGSAAAPAVAANAGLVASPAAETTGAAGTTGGAATVRVVCAYIPNGQSLESDKYRYKLDWLDGLQGYMAAQTVVHTHTALLGDYNIAPEDRDVHDPAAWQGQVLVSAAERAHFQKLLDAGFTDCFRLFEQPGKLFSWWDYRMLGFRRNAGMRIDHILASPALAATCRACVIDKAPRKREQPSDHTPVVADFSL